MKSPPKSKSKRKSEFLSFSLVVSEDYPVPLQIFDPRSFSEKRLRRSPRLTPPHTEVNVVRAPAEKKASLASNQSKPLRSALTPSSACETRNAALQRLRPRGTGRSPALNSSADPGLQSGALPGSPRKSSALKCQSSLGKSHSGMSKENSPRRSPRFELPQNGKPVISTGKEMLFEPRLCVELEIICLEFKSLKSKGQSLTLNANEKGRIMFKVGCSEEKCLRRSERLSPTQTGTKSKISKASKQKTSSRNTESKKGHLEAVSPKTYNLRLRSSNESKTELASLSRNAYGDKASMPLKYYHTEFFGERHLRRSPRLFSATENVGSSDARNEFHAESFNRNHLRKPPRLSLSLSQTDNMQLDSNFFGLSKSDEQPSKMIIPCSGKSDMDKDCLRQSPKTETSLHGAENGKRVCSFIELSDSNEKQSPNKFKATTSKSKQKKYQTMSFFIGDPIPDGEAQERWRWRYEMKSQRSNGQGLTFTDEEEDKIVWNVQCHYAQARIANCNFCLGDCASIKGNGGQKHVGRILEFFRTTDGEDYFRVQWFYRVEDTVIREEGAFHDKRRLFYSTLMNDNLIDCIISKVSVTKVTPKVGRRLNFIAPSDFFYDMEYCVDYSTFRSLVIDNAVGSHAVSSPDSIQNFITMTTPNILEHAPNHETNEAQLALLDLFSGCGGMSTGLCLGAKLSSVSLVTKWALDSDRSACESLKLNHPETHVRKETAENFLELLKEWEKLCRRYKWSDVGRTYPSRAKTFRADERIRNSVDADEIPTDEYEVSRLTDICFGDPNETGKRGLNFKVHWKGFRTSEDTWEPIAGLSNCHEKLQDFVRNGLKMKILPLPGEVDVICGGPPCQGISGYNRFRNIDSPLADDRNRQIVVFMDIVNFLKPKYVLMENVVDILRFDKASLGRYALSRLVQMNYQARLGTIAAGCYGLPQFRLRVFLWGAQASEKLPQFPLPTHDVVVRYWPPPEFERNTVAYDEDQPRELGKALVLQDAISDLPAVTNSETREEMAYQKGPETEFQTYIRSTQYEMTGSTLNGSLETKHSIYDHRPYTLSEDDYLRVCQIPKRKGANFRDLPGVVVGIDNVAQRDPAKQKLLPSGKPLVPDYAFTFEKGKSRRPFARLWWDETVPTVVTFPSCHNQAALHPEQDRALTIREYARLQGFPDYYQFCGTIKERYCQIGNAVAVPVARALGYALGLAFQKRSGDEPLMTLPPKFSHSNYLQLAKSLTHNSH